MNQSGTYIVTVTYGNNCSAVSTPITVTLSPIPATPTATSNSPVKLGNVIQLGTNAVANAIYRWTGPNGFTHTAQNPSMPSATVDMAGTYYVTDTVNGCGSAPASVNVELYGEVAGRIKTETGIGIKTATVAAIGPPNQTWLTNSTGIYSFNLTAGNTFTIAPSKNNDSIRNNGITVADYIAVRLHIRGNKLLQTPYKIIAADVNSDGVVNDLDLISINRMIDNQYGLLIIGKLWAFVPHDYVFSNPQNPFPFPSSRTHMVTANRSTQDFIGMKLGDVNNSWNPNRSTADTLELSVPHLTVNKDSDILVPVVARNFKTISAFQFTLQWDPAVLTYGNMDTTLGALKVSHGEDSVASGKLVVSWIDDVDSSTTLPDNSQLFYVRFKAIGNYNGISPIQINSEISIVEALDSAYNNLEVKVTNGEVKINSGVSVNIHELNTPEVIRARVFPNPFANQTTLSIELNTEQRLNVDIFDLQGRIICSYQRGYAGGNHDEMLNNLPGAGTYFLRITGQHLSEPVLLRLISL